MPCKKGSKLISSVVWVCARKKKLPGAGARMCVSIGSIFWGDGGMQLMRKGSLGPRFALQRGGVVWGACISCDQLATLLDGEGATVLDLRSKEEWDAGHIPGSEHVAFEMIDDYCSRLGSDCVAEGTLVLLCMYSQERAPRSATSISYRLQELNSKCEVKILNGWAGWATEVVESD
eukprot:NODE_3802_length_730_cov_43.546256_g3205_i0.p2 GENE.NODE_3802_length_730_cov_43.546256_g3205_i0~~NODE_3802_length_730_cov_43.546256_g3205_i0.p2  ORF type:complete len:176 (-),score=18.08 NODE_3802_length_730_cov_43.546256_g3205_i0:77-604(-)